MIHRPSRGASRRHEERPELASRSGHDRRSYTTGWDAIPRGIRKHLDLNKPIYARTSSYGHFGRKPDADGGFSWEKTDLADKLKAAMK